MPSGITYIRNETNDDWIPIAKGVGAGGGGGGLTTGYHAMPAAAVTVATGTTTLIPTTTATFDINGEHDSATGRWICGADGVYLVFAQCYFATGTTGYRNVYIYKNATTTGTPGVLATGTRIGLGQSTDANGEEFPIAMCLVQLVATDYLELFVRHSQGSPLVCGDTATYPYSWLGIVRIN